MKIFWASPNTLLDTSNGAAMMVRECLRQLAMQHCEIRILSGSVFVNTEGMSGRHDLWLALQKRKGQFVNLQDGVLNHRLLVTEQSQRRLLYSYEEKRWFDEYRRLLDSERPDLVLFFDNSLITLLTAHEARRRNVAVGVFLMHGNNQGQDWCQDVDWMFTDTHATAQMYREREGYRMLPVGTFVNPDGVRAQAHTRERLLFINPVPAKGAVLVIQTALWLAKHRPEVKLEVVDSRKSWQSLLQQVNAALGAPDMPLSNLLVTANTLDMRPVYGRARLLIVPSVWWESGPRVIVEALLNGIPVIGSDSGGIPEVLGDGGEIFPIPQTYRQAPYTRLFPQDMVEVFAARICRYWDDEVFYQHASERALQAHAHAHNLEKNGVALKGLVERCLRQRASAPETAT